MKKQENGAKTIGIGEKIMATYEKVPIVCRCGRQITTVSNNIESKNKISGTFSCPSCKKKGRYTIQGGHVSLSYD